MFKDIWAVILPFVQDWQTVLMLRLVHKDVDEAIQTIHIDVGYPQRTFLHFGRCTHCARTGTFQYKIVRFSREPKPIYVHCSRWMCHYANILGMQRDCKKRGAVILTKPLPLETSFRIPRSDPTKITMGSAPFQMVYKLPGYPEWNVYCEWMEGFQQFEKGVPSNLLGITDEWIDKHTLQFGKSGLIITN